MERQVHARLAALQAAQAALPVPREAGRLARKAPH
jgi:hypothetical protein